MKIACLGSAPSSLRLAPFLDANANQFHGGRPILEQHQAPYLDESWEIWGCSPGVYGQVPRIDRYFELHRWEPGQSWFSPEYCSWLRAFKGPVYMGGHVPEVPNCTLLPIEKLTDEFGPYCWTSSLAYMTAMAIMMVQMDRAAREATGEGKDEKDAIGLWGVDMAANEEYRYQRPALQFLIHECKRRGIAFVLPPESDLNRPMPPYGLSEWSHSHIKLTARMREYDARIAQAQQAIQQASNELNFIQGAKSDLGYVMETWINQPEISPVPGFVGISPSGQQLLHLTKHEPVYEPTAFERELDVVRKSGKPDQPEAFAQPNFQNDLPTTENRPNNTPDAAEITYGAATLPVGKQRHKTRKTNSRK